MGFYQEYVLPRLVNLAMRNRELVPYRKRAIAAADGRVLEIGIGSGLNLPFYSPHVREIIGLEPAPKLIAMAREAAMASSIPVTLVEGSAEAIPLDDASIDAVVTTWTLCTIPNAVQALREARRVLAPGGRLLFVEHGLSSDESVRRWQDFLTPAWKRIGGGCHLNRPIRSLIESGGFDVARIEMGYAKGPRPMAFMYEGCARPA
ncbi:MAG: phospholipid methyltransferase [Rhizobiales bacterium 65-79]|nr:class I SAM-dependent methyltransferase [Hyphomicrobiales bacterium]OJU04830.1 MAG: phospholipid methyltransferase [Rhizobiales bacterium 65-79]